MTSLTRILSLSAAIALSAVALLPATSRAQRSDDAQADVFPTSEPGNGFGGSSFSPFDLIHRATLGTLRDSREFRRDAARNLNDAAAEFRRQQMERLQNPPAAAPEAPSAAPESPAES